MNCTSMASKGVSCVHVAHCLQGLAAEQRSDAGARDRGRVPEVRAVRGDEKALRVCVERGRWRDICTALYAGCYARKERGVAYVSSKVPCCWRVAIREQRADVCPRVGEHPDRRGWLRSLQHVLGARRVGAAVYLSGEGREFVFALLRWISAVWHSPNLVVSVRCPNRR
jgi:hypothetical protein